MLNFNQQPNLGDAPVDPADPNSPTIPVPGDPDHPYLDQPPTPRELQAVSGGNMGGVAEDLTETVVAELASRGITINTIRNLAVGWGVSMAQAAAIAIGRNMQNSLNKVFKTNFGGTGNGGDPPLIFSAPNSQDGGSGPGGPAGGGPGRGEYGMAHHPYLHNHLDTNGKPGEVQLNVGLKVRGYVPYFKEANTSYSSPLHITCVLPQMPQDTNYTVGRFNVNSILLRFIERVGRSVNQQLDANTFTASNINAYFNLILKGLSYYYWYESIYAYSMLKADTNDALVYLRRSMSSDTLNELMVLRSTLASLPIPPNMVTYVYWMYQNWQVHSLGDSPVIKLCPFAIDQTTKLPNPADISSVYTALNTGTNRSLTGVLVKAFDDWYEMDLPPSSITLEHSADFTTLWANAPCEMSDTTAPSYGHFQPFSSSSTGAVNYITFTDELDGAVQAMFSIYDTSKSAWAPTFVTPVTTTWGTVKSNRFSWAGTTSKFVNSYNYPVLSVQRPDSLMVTPSFSTSGISLGPVTAMHNPFSERIYSVNIDTVSEVATEMLRWMLNFDNITEFTGSAGRVMSNAPRGKALNQPSSSKQNKWTRKKRDGQSPQVDKLIDDMSGEL